MYSADERLAQVRRQIEAACHRSGRDPSHVTLIGAGKTVEASRVLEYAQAGLRFVGENYVQEGVAKQQSIAALAPNLDSLHWHLIGALQSNKARDAVASFELIHSVDRLSLAQALDKAAREAGKVQDVLLQVNTGNEASKAGCAPERVVELARACAALPHIVVRGLMCLPPYQEDAEYSRPHFRLLQQLGQEVKATLSSTQADAHTNTQVWHLSMGMTNDFHIAIEEGATLVRIGTGLFGARS
ncbi:MAG TPA: YggS family pyridoxal phosphate-dependent enzyme [Abditibacteriaceae bacterium]